jgi:DNA-binding NarL/FixJ family response regulator
VLNSDATNDPNEAKRLCPPAGGVGVIRAFRGFGADYPSPPETHCRKLSNSLTTTRTDDISACIRSRDPSPVFRAGSERRKVASRKIRVLAVDDHPLLLQGVVSIVEMADDIELVGEAKNGLQAVERFGALRPDVTVMDVHMPVMNGIDALVAIRELDAEAQVIMLTVSRGEAQARRAIRAGAAGYLLKSMVQKELREAIRVVHAGGKYIPPEIALELVTGSVDEVLSDAEIEVLELVAKGLSNKRIGVVLNVPEESVKSRMKSILAKLSANDRTHAVMLALKRGMIDID